VLPVAAMGASSWSPGAFGPRLPFETALQSHQHNLPMPFSRTYNAHTCNMTTIAL